MCQAWLESRSPECVCGGGYLAGLDNWIDHTKDCPVMHPKPKVKEGGNDGR